MDMKELQEKLTEKNLNIFQQIRYTFFVLGKFIFDKNDVWWILFFFFISCVKITIGFISVSTGISSFANILQIFKFCYYLAFFLFYQKIIFKIEEKNYSRLDKSASKFFLLYLIYYIISYIFRYLPFPLFFDEFNLAFGIVSLMVLVIFWIYLFYFIPLFSARPFDLRESWDYNLHLIKGNKLKRVFPGILCFIFSFSAIFIFLLPIVSLFEELGINLLLLISNFGVIAGEFINTFMVIFFIILHSIIYLNVEYLDRKIK